MALGYFKLGVSRVSLSMYNYSTSGTMSYPQDRVSYTPLQTKGSWIVFAILEVRVNINDKSY